MRPYTDCKGYDVFPIEARRHNKKGPHCGPFLHNYWQLPLNAAPASGQAVTAGFHFDTPVRFDTDRMETTLESFEAGRMAAVPLIEVRV